MKIKRLTAGLAVAAMAATFFAAAPILSAQAAQDAAPLPAYPQISYGGTPFKMYDITAPDVPGNSSLTINVFDSLLQDGMSSTPLWQYITVDYTNSTLYAIADLASITDPANGTSGASGTASQYGANGVYVSSWNCNASDIIVEDGSGTPQPSYGYVSCGKNGTLTYTPTLVMGSNGDIPIILHYAITTSLTALANSTFGQGMVAAGNSPLLQHVTLAGNINLTVTFPQNLNACGKDAACLNADVQAYGKKDNPNSVKIDLLTPNIFIAASNPTGILKASDVPASWGLSAVNAPTSVDTTIPTATLQSFVSYTKAKGSNTVKFTPPVNWSGTVTYDYVIAKYTCGNSGTDACSSPDPVSGAPRLYVGSVTFTTHPTLPDIDPIASDPGVKVTVPVLEQSIIGSKAFMNAACTFADTKSKTTLAGTGTISNKGGSKDPIFTPDAAFTGSVDLACTVQDKFGITSNSVTVTVQVGVPAPAPVAPTPACGDSCNGGKLVSTGGSLAAPMSSGLAAVVLLVAAGAGILVVRRRTALAG